MVVVSSVVVAVVGSMVDGSVIVEVGSGDDRLDNVADSVETAAVYSTVIMACIFKG